jgi:pyruvate/2-oxoglutarate dehydrogenase complex dihydrolipoamide acyltransferase (E2) component
MKKENNLGKYTITTFPRTRIATLDVMEQGRKKHHIKALLELDVTGSRAAIKEFRRQTGEKLSFTAWLVKTISATIQEFQDAHAYLLSKRKSIVFDDIDISITVERVYDGQPVPLPYVIRQSDKKSFQTIHQEIQTVKTKDLAKEDIVLGEKQNRLATDLYYFMPGFLRRMVWRFILKHPKIAKKSMGSVMISSIGMMGRVNGWFIHTSVHPVSFGVGSIIPKPWVKDGSVTIREILNMTALIDHDVMDGAPMARFFAKLTQNIESGLGLEDYLKP